MRENWFGDKRDLVKWAVLTHLAQKTYAKRIIQIAYFRPFDDSTSLIKNESNLAKDIGIFPDAVLDFFKRWRSECAAATHYLKKLEKIEALGQKIGIDIKVFKEPFTNRVKYRELTVEYFRDIESPKIVLLDPDTGIEPNNVSLDHITGKDISIVYKSLNPTDTLVIYQHRWFDEKWKSSAMRKFATAIDCEDKDIACFECPSVANDVILLSKTRLSD
jgi:hypothetical protein